ncbi:MAG: rhodanese-like domain-containing protein [Alphaproteobacteria bacterium]
MKIIDKTVLQQDLNSKQDILLIDVLPVENFNKQHIPSAINVPFKDNANFVKDVEAKAKSKSQRIVVYCANTQCPASQQAAEKLEQAGFANVQRFEEGVEGWFATKAAA